VPDFQAKQTDRETAFGTEGVPWTVRVRDRLILGRLLRRGRPYTGRRIADIGCGYYAASTRIIADDARSLVLVDVAIAPELAARPNITAVEGTLPDSLDAIPDGSLDVVICSAVLEHLWSPAETLKEIHRVLAPRGVALLSVPSWLGKRMLEFLAFRLNLSTDEMDDHKMYYDPRDLWPLMVRAGFMPHAIKCFRHKFGLNTFAVATATTEENYA
jgi:SAM-dependent methyltransferase